MPKVNLRPIDCFEQMIRRNFELVKGGKSCEEIGQILGCCKMTASKRGHDPLALTLAELFLLCKHEHIEPADFVGGELRLRGDM